MGNYYEREDTGWCAPGNHDVQRNGYCHKCNHLIPDDDPSPRAWGPFDKEALNELSPEARKALGL